MTANLLTLNSFKSDWNSNCRKLRNFSIETTHSTHNRCFIFEEHLPFFYQMSALSKSCYYHIRELRAFVLVLISKRLPPLSFTPKFIIVIYYSLLRSQLNQLQPTQDSLARTVVEPPRFSPITPIYVLKSLHWLKQMNALNRNTCLLQHEAFTTSQFCYLCNSISVQPRCSTRSSSVVTISRPPTSSFIIPNRSFRYAAPYL